MLCLSKSPNKQFALCEDVTSLQLSGLEHPQGWGVCCPGAQAVDLLPASSTSGMWLRPPDPKLWVPYRQPQDVHQHHREASTSVSSRIEEWKADWATEAGYYEKNMCDVRFAVIMWYCTCTSSSAEWKINPPHLALSSICTSCWLHWPWPGSSSTLVAIWSLELRLVVSAVSEQESSTVFEESQVAVNPI